MMLFNLGQQGLILSKNVEGSKGSKNALFTNRTERGLGVRGKCLFLLLLLFYKYIYI
jgi:hypothetical protein